ncbi:hypothetical protein QVD17_15977 [Tagetes erecta]|uniref:Uncharacterized protein n=1 Tax=Tagetes erecta TaxID=13708 RepID=A0AAD8P055_TARER|nr:hypothetical protein QVD17_15977 [Tagetes erecta]
MNRKETLLKLLKNFVQAWDRPRSLSTQHRYLLDLVINEDESNRCVIVDGCDEGQGRLRWCCLMVATMDRGGGGDGRGGDGRGGDDRGSDDKAATAEAMEAEAVVFDGDNMCEIKREVDV